MPSSSNQLASKHPRLPGRITAIQSSPMTRLHPAVRHQLSLSHFRHQHQILSSFLHARSVSRGWMIPLVCLLSSASTSSTVPASKNGKGVGVLFVAIQILPYPILHPKVIITHPHTSHQILRSAAARLHSARSVTAQTIYGSV